MFKLGDVMTASKSSSAFDPRRTANSRTRHAASLACLVLAGTVSAGARADNSASATAAPDLDEIVVTATRRAESIDKIPISISAFSQPKMDEQGIKSVDDLARFTPGLTFAPSTDGLTSSIAIRGIASGVGASTTGIYINDTPIQVRSGTGIVTQNSYPQIFDLERVEVLKGPQGTLFGTGSMGGTIRFITPEPNLNTYSGYARAETSTTKGGDPSYEMGAAVGGPIVDGVLGFRASAFYQNEGGYINREPFTGDTVTQKGVNFSDTTVLRYAVKWAPSDSVTITPSIYYQKQRRNDAYFWESLSNPSETDFNSGYTLPEPITDSFTLPAFDVHWKFGSMELISNTSFFYRSLRRDSDYSNYLFNAFTGNPTPTAPVADYRALSEDAVRQNSFTQEVRLQSTDAASNLQWVAGALFQNSRLYTNQYVVDRQLPQLSLSAFGAPIQDVFGEGLYNGQYSFAIDQWARDRQTALFGQVDYGFTSSLKATVGVRVARATLDFNRSFAGPLACVLCNGSVETTGGSTPATTPVTPRAGLSYEPDAQSLYYVSAAKGARVGGINNPAVATGNAGCPAGLPVPNSYAPDSLWSYEIGAKNQFADGRFRTQASIYYIDWKNVQQSVSSNGCFTSSYKTNLGDAGVTGIDLAAEWKVVENLSLSISGGYSRARYTTTSFGPADATGARAIISEDGDSLGVSPWNVTLSGEYDFVAWNHNAYFRIDDTYSAKDDGETPVRDSRTSVYDPGLVADPAVRLLEARLGIRIAGFDVSVFGRNLLNDTPALGVNHDGVGDPLYYATTVRPRTIGITGSYRF
jgi:iron complex outermembrane receptor protein